MTRHRRPQGFQRTDRIADQIQRELSRLLQFEMKDPRLGLVTVNEVKVSSDLSWADVYFTVMGEEIPEAQEVLTHAGGFLRSQLAAVLNTRTTPKLRFHYDELPEKASHLSSLISQAVAEDHEHQRARGDEDTADDGDDEIQE